jgi:hypothetical protein
VHVEHKAHRSTILSISVSLRSGAMLPSRRQEEPLL